MMHGYMLINVELYDTLCIEEDRKVHVMDRLMRKHVVDVFDHLMNLEAFEAQSWSMRVNLESKKYITSIILRFRCGKSELEAEFDVKGFY